MRVFARARIHLRSGWLLIGILLMSPAVAAAQGGGCVFGNEGNDVFQRVTLPGGQTIHYVTNPYFECEGGVRVWADSAVAYSASSMSHLIGSVRYLDATRELRSDEARYFSDVGRLEAQGNVWVEDLDQGSVVENGDLLYLRETDFRPEETMTVTVAADGIRPRATLRNVGGGPDSLGAEAEAAGNGYVVVGDQIVLRGNSRFTASGDVEIQQDSLMAFADSARYEGDEDQLLLRGSARLEGDGYDLSGRSIDVLSPGGEESEIRALRDALLTGEELRLTSEQILLYLLEGSLQRLVAVPITPDGVPATDTLPEADSTSVRRPVAVTEDFELVADSLEVVAPDETLERVFAAGNARSVSHSADSLAVEELPEIARNDWIEGDTIIFVFTAAVPDSAEVTVPADSVQQGNQIERIVAKRSARSLYRLPPSDSAAESAGPPAVHYVVGDEITLLLVLGKIERMEVSGQTRGVHLEPYPRVQRPDSAATPPEPPSQEELAVPDTISGDVSTDPPGPRIPAGARTPPPAPTPVESQPPWSAGEELRR